MACRAMDHAQHDLPFRPDRAGWASLVDCLDANCAPLVYLCQARNSQDLFANPALEPSIISSLSPVLLVDCRSCGLVRVAG